MKHQSETTAHLETIRGVVVPGEWDNRFQVTALLIACKGEREIRVENLDRFPDLLAMARQEAIITGTISKNGPTESIVVEHISSLELTESS